MGKSKRKYQANDIQEQAASNQCTNAGAKPKKKARAQESTREEWTSEVSTREEFTKEESTRDESTREVEALANDSVLDKYRLQHEVADHWELRRMFLEKNYHSLPEDELECLAQVFMNIELMHCRYPPETMARVAKLSEGISSDYRRRRCKMLQRTLVSARSIAASKVQRKPLALAENNGADPKTPTQSMEKKLDLFEPIMYPKSLEETLRNIIVLNNAFDETMQAYKRLGVEGGWKMETTKTSGGIITCVKVGRYIIEQVEGKASPKNLEKRARAAALEFLKKRCYTILRKKQLTEMDGVTVISKTSCDDNDIDTEKIGDPEKIGSGNIGFQLMAKLGWKGGSLGTRGDGIIDPVSTQLQVGRKGLGHENPNESEKNTMGSYGRFKKQLIALRDGNLKNHLVFSPEFTTQERAEIRSLALKVGGLQMKSIGSNELRQLVVYRPEASPHEKLQKILIEKDPFYCELYEVISPTL